MVKHFDHCTIVVRDVERAKMFFGVLGFKEAVSVVIAGEPFASYMGVPGIEADHVTLCWRTRPLERKFNSCDTGIPSRCPIHTFATCTKLG
jgi:catechol 2,3-dioxygenase-like lactoylglutathione lyase family enzyme